MEKLTLGTLPKKISPEHVALVCSRRPEGTTNLAAVSWWTIVSLHPVTIAFAMGKKSFSGERIREERDVLLTVPGSELAEIVMECGSHSGRNCDKVQEYEIPLVDIPGSTIKAPDHSRLVLVMLLQRYLEVGDHYLYICEVSDGYVDDKEDSLYAWDGYRDVGPVR